VPYCANKIIIRKYSDTWNVQKFKLDVITKKDKKYFITEVIKDYK